jgi:predicted membrane chloride channel (bestrophin family)
MIVLTVIDRHFSEVKVSIEITQQGHTFITLVVAFLLVSRVTIALSRYNEARACLGTMYRETRELTQNACVFSADSTDESSREWRQELGYRCLILLRTTMAAIDYPVTKLPAWEVPELNGVEKEEVQKSTYLKESRRWAHAKRTESEESMRVPIRVGYLLRKTIFSQSQRLQNPIHILQVNKMLFSVDEFMNGYHGMRVFMTTPVPFPLVQMARTFLFLYVFTMPFVFLADESSIFAHCFAVFVITYGFVGLEFVAIEMDNPFGDYANNFDNT